MTTNNIDRQRCIDQSNERHRIGTDALGRPHYYSPARAVIWVRDGDALEVCYRTRDLGAWRDYVAEKCGWADHSIESVSTPELAASAIAEAAQ